LLECIRRDDRERFVEIFQSQTRKYDDPSEFMKQRTYTDQPQIDEFGLLAEIVHSENVDLLEIINKKQLFPIAQKDESTGDNLLHYAIFENKT
jgi:hypothetical protein